ELTNHLGNVLVVINDKKIPEFNTLDTPGSGLKAFNADVLTYSDYYPFGMVIDARHRSKTDYRYGFQGQEMDNEIKGEGNSLNYTFRMHDPRVGRFFARDPLAHKFPYNSPYAFSENRVIDGVEFEGLEVTPYAEKKAYKPVFTENAGTVMDRAGNAAENIMSFLTNVTVTPAYNASSSVINGTYDFFTGKYNNVTLPGMLQEAEFGVKEFVRTNKNYWDKNSGKQILKDNINSLSVLENYELGAELLIAHKVSSFAGKGSSGVAVAEDIVDLRKSLARNFYEKSGFDGTKALSHMEGIDFGKAVQTKILKKGTVVQQWVGEHGVGNYFTTITNKAAQNLGIGYEGRTLKQFTLTEDVKVLQSTAGDYKGHAGGGTQFFSTELRNKITPTP
ncbi:RHS repeat-associated core domain-containing protein, partial [Flavobacterium sp. UBA4197]|uniref:RHS repeat-associated core domain-containing protein n=1 Tax=Flavobacterium sp. UBA4197 TaxID=1946546 RepID=UPI002580026A